MITGTPVASASAMAPGPALVTVTSHARISSGMKSTNPSTSVGVAKWTRARRRRSRSLRPHTATTCQGWDSQARTRTCFKSWPAPAAPPMARTVNRRSSRPKRRRSALFSPGAGGRNRRSTGRPKSLILSAGTRRLSATLRASSVGAMTRSALLNVHPRWKSTRSVMTVISARGRPLRWIAW